MWFMCYCILKGRKGAPGIDGDPGMDGPPGDPGTEASNITLPACGWSRSAVVVIVCCVSVAAVSAHTV